MRKIVIIHFTLTTLMLAVGISQLKAQTSEDKIKQARAASNAALKSLEDETYMQFLTDDVLITTGSGTLLSGKHELRSYIDNLTDTEPLYFVRTAEEIIVNENRGLAWEVGVWHGYENTYQNGSDPVYHGNYAAQWIKISEVWKIQSQLFVTLN